MEIEADTGNPGYNEKVTLNQCNGLLYTLRTCDFITKSTMNTMDSMGMIIFHSRRVV